jgi:hypothetical protein
VESPFRVFPGCGNDRVAAMAYIDGLLRISLFHGIAGEKE